MNENNMKVTAETPQVKSFVAEIERRIKAYWDAQGYSASAHMELPRIEVMEGPRYLRLVRFDSTSRSAHSFIDRNTGDILKTSSWKAPAPRGIRGNIFLVNTDGSCASGSCLGDFGEVAYLR